MLVKMQGRFVSEQSRKVNLPVSEILKTHRNKVPDYFFEKQLMSDGTLCE